MLQTRLDAIIMDSGRRENTSVAADRMFEFQAVGDSGLMALFEDGLN
jgi:hypothetical protein